MKTHAMGSAGAAASVLGLGTWQMENDDRADAVAALRAGLDLGMTHIDTAELYGSGRVEELVGDAIEGRREEVFLVSKVMPSNASRRGAIAACEKSLRRLRTDHLDCYLLHWPGSVPLEETVRAFEDLEAAGKIRSFGVSNFDEEDLESLMGLVEPSRIAQNQVLYHLGERAIEHAVLPLCERHGIAVVGYSPFGTDDFPSASSARGRTLADIAGRYGATPRQIALAFLVRRPSLFAIPKSSRIDHVRDNAAADRIDLTAADLETLDQAFPLGRRRPGVPML
jgi:diketogulonate reductase-like aldo/keto reductase